MAENRGLVKKLFETTSMEEGILQDPEVAHLFIHHNQVVGARDLPGLTVMTRELKDGVHVSIELAEGTTISKPVHMCFGMMPQEGVQKIDMDVNILNGASISILAHCTFPFAVDVRHIMDARINIGENSSYRYFERHIHGAEGGVKVYPKARIYLKEGALFKTEFELLKGRVGLIDIDYEAECGRNSTIDMTARIDGKGDDLIKIKEVGKLSGEHSTGVLTSRVALRDSARAEVYNRITADAAYARGHVDCKEIVKDKGSANAVPVVEVNNPRAHVTHEAAIGSVDSKQLQTLMARGLNEDDASDLIIKGLLS